MSWAARRQTTREENIAYCLGIFGVNTPTPYGEGKRAFIRLQEGIIMQNNDLTLFAWRANSTEEFRGILAQTPEEFQNAGDIMSSHDRRFNPEFSVTNKGLRVTPRIIKEPIMGDYIMMLN